MLNLHVQLIGYSIGSLEILICLNIIKYIIFIYKYISRNFLIAFIETIWYTTIVMINFIAPISGKYEVDSLTIELREGQSLKNYIDEQRVQVFENICDFLLKQEDWHRSPSTLAQLVRMNKDQILKEIK